MEILIAALLIGLLPAAIAKSKGYSFMGWWLFGAALFIVALPVAICMKSSHKGENSVPSAPSGLRARHWFAASAATSSPRLTLRR